MAGYSVKFNVRLISLYYLRHGVDPDKGSGSGRGLDTDRGAVLVDPDETLLVRKLRQPLKTDFSFFFPDR